MGYQRLRVAVWVLAVAALAAGFYVGFNINANVGAFLLLASGVLALGSFALHRPSN